MPKIKRGTKRKIESVIDTRDEHWVGFQERIPGRYRHLVNNPNLSDMSFVVGAQRVRMRGHKLIVGVSSSVLYIQMQSMDPFDPEIVIPDISSEIWLKVLQFMYGHPIETMLTPENVLGCLKCARRYKLKNLRDKCAYFIRSNFLLVNDDIPVNMLNSVTITEAIEMRRDIRSTDSTSVVTIQWRNPFVLSTEELSSDDIRRLLIMHLRNLETSYMFNSVLAWYRNECTLHKMPKDQDTFLKFILIRCRRINFPTLTSRQFFNCVSNCNEFLVSEKEIENIKKNARVKRRRATKEKRKLYGPHSGISTATAKAGIFEVSLLQNIREIQIPKTPDCLNHTTFTLTCNKVIAVQGFAVPVVKEGEGDITVIFMSNNSRLMEKSTTSGMRRLYNTKYEFLYLFLENTVLLDPEEEYQISIRSFKGAFSLIGDFHREVCVNDIKFTFHSFHQPHCHALFMLFEDPGVGVDSKSYTLMDLAFSIRCQNINCSGRDSPAHLLIFEEEIESIALIS